jgi:hypothetical protein
MPLMVYRDHRHVLVSQYTFVPQYRVPRRNGRYITNKALFCCVEAARSKALSGIDPARPSSWQDSGLQGWLVSNEPASSYWPVNSPSVWILNLPEPWQYHLSDTHGITRAPVFKTWIICFWIIYYLNKKARPLLEFRHTYSSRLPVTSVMLLTFQYLNVEFYIHLKRFV